MYGQSCGEPLRFGGGSLCWGRSVTFHSHRFVGIPQVRWVHLPRPWLPLVYVSRPGLCWEGGVVGGEEGVGAVHHPVASWCMVVGGGEGVVQIVHEGHVRGGGWLLVVRGGDGPGTWCLKLFRLAIRATHVSLSHSLVSLGVGWVGDGPCWARGSGCGPWCPPAPARGVRLGVAPRRWGAPRFGPPRGAGSRCLGRRVGGGRVGQRGGRRRRGSLGRLPAG